jgi:membrane protease YdiL (CAAX protease family)
MQIETVSKITKEPRPASLDNLRGYAASVAAGWLATVAAGIVYARMKGVAAGVATPIIAAFLLELPLYLAPFFESARTAAVRLGRWQFAGGLAATAVLPYLAYSIPTGCFNGFDFFRVAGLAVSLSFWYLLLPLNLWSDLLFLAAPAAIMISKVLKQVYASPLPHVPIDILGHLMLIHVAALAILVLRGLTGVKPGLIPTRLELWIGVRAFLIFLPVGLALAWLLHMKMRAAPFPLWYAAPMFLGSYLVVSFSEEFAFRGVLQQHLSRLTGNWTGLVMASILFGLSHLNFGRFPNWHLVVLAGASGLFNGWAYQEAGSIRASMVAHALTAVTWLIWLR